MAEEYTVLVNDADEKVNITVQDDNEIVKIVVKDPLITGIPEAPVDTKSYARKDAGWEEVAGFPEAPEDGNQYGRKDAAWEEITIPPSTPTTTLGDLIRRGASADERLPIGNETEQLIVVSGVPAWQAKGIVSYAHLTQLNSQNVGGANGTIATIIWDGAQINVDTADFTHSTSVNPTRVTVVNDCRISIDWNIGAQQLGANRTGLSSRVLVNGVDVYERGRERNYTRGSAYSDVSIGMTTEIDLLAGDYFECQTIVDDTDAVYTLNSFPLECELIARRIDQLGGTKGEKGEPGNDGDDGDDGGVQTIVADTGSVIAVDQAYGTLCNYSDPNDEVTYTLGTLVANAYARVLITTAGIIVFPTVTGATLIEGHAFEADYFYEIFVEYIDSIVYYSFIKRNPN